VYIHFIKKFLFIAVPKTGSRTIHDFLFNNIENPDRERIWNKSDYHLPLKEITKIYPIKGFYKFAFVRNPLDRLISTYLDFTKNTETHREFAQKFKNDFKNFDEFVLNFHDTEWAEEIHMRPATWYLENDKNEVDINFVGRYENFMEDFLSIINQLKINKKNEYFFPTLGKTIKDKKFEGYYSSQKLINKVKDFYHSDFVKFNYEQ
tara:strand:+ start:347 stop:964 length:618 start_codon:yes stop_codon:yes gene_type:complete